jgi:hypothetical protein
LGEQDKFLDLEAETVLHFAFAQCGDAEGSAIEILRHPSLFERELQQRGS